MYLGGRVLATAVATHHGDLGLEGASGQTQHGSHFVHVGARAGQAVDVAFFGGLFHTSLGQGTAASEAAAAAVGARQTSLRFINQRVLFHLEPLCYEVQNHGKNAAQDSENR